MFGGGKTITLNAGTLNVLESYPFHSDIENFGTLNLPGGANTIHIQNDGTEYYQGLGINAALNRVGPATLNLTSNRIYSFKNAFVYFLHPEDPSVSLTGGIVFWWTINGEEWATYSLGEAGDVYFEGRRVAHEYSFTSADAGPETTWNAGLNVTLNTNQTLTANRTINSLRLPSATSVLNLGSNALEITSGGLLATIGNSRIRGSSTLTTGSNRTLYVHTYGETLTLEDEVKLVITNLIKTGPGTLVLDSDATHELQAATGYNGGLWINQGIIRLLKGMLRVAAEIIVGDGAGEDAFELGDNLINPIQAQGGGLASITLHGNRYGPSTDAAILRLGTSTRQQLATLHIQDRGLLDFSTGSTKAAPNILYLDQLTLNDANARLTVRNWSHQAAYLLVKKTWGDTNVPPNLAKIHFEGYGDLTWHWHDLGSPYGDYWQILPLSEIPEPATYGAILGAAGLGLWLWRRRRRVASAIHARATKGSTQDAARVANRSAAFLGELGEDFSCKVGHLPCHEPQAHLCRRSFFLRLRL